MQSIANLPECWVCHVRFSDVDPPGPANREEHHIIPRQAGGTDGPQVSLCENHHGKLHKVASRMSSNKPYFDLMYGEQGEREKKLLWLASRVYMAFQATAKDPNKKKMVVLTLGQKQQLMLDQLKRVYPQAKSREALYDLALLQLYQRHFAPEPN
jgi:hypothetical protein